MVEFIIWDELNQMLTYHLRGPCLLIFRIRVSERRRKIKITQPYAQCLQDDSCAYLGTILTKDNNEKDEVNRRINETLYLMPAVLCCADDEPGRRGKNQCFRTSSLQENNRSSEGGQRMANSGELEL